MEVNNLSLSVELKQGFALSFGGDVLSCIDTILCHRKHEKIALDRSTFKGNEENLGNVQNHAVAAAL